MKTAFYLLLVLCVLSGCQSTQPMAEEAPTSVLTEPSDPTEVIRVYRVDGLPYEPDRDAYDAAQKALQAKLSINNDNLSLAEVIAFIREQTGVNLVVNWPALELVGIDQDSLVTVQLNNVSARILLQVTLEQVSADAFDNDKAGFAVRDGIVKVTTIRDLYDGVETRIYDVAWFLDPRLNISAQLYDRQDPKRTGWLKGRIKETGEQITIDASRLSNWHFFCAQCGGVTDKDGDITYDMYSRQELVDQLIESIQVTVGDPNEWLDEASYLTEMGERLVITTTPENHDAILDLLKTHRRLQVEAFEQQAKAIAVTVLLREAETHRLKRNYRKALELIDEALKVDPSHAETRVLRGLVVRVMQD